MLLTVIVTLPRLEIVNVAVAVVPVMMLPNAKLPLNPMICVGTGMPAPEAEIVFVPLAASQLMVTVPL